MNKIIYYTGTYGPLFLIFLSILFIYKNQKYQNLSSYSLLFYFIIGVFFNSIFNILLKGIIQQPRPLYDINKFNIIINNNKTKNYFFQNGIPFDIFGMPSGHAQATFFATTFIWLSLKNINLTLFYLFISFITLYQRVKYNYHSIIQVFIGSIIGIIFALFIYYLATNKLKGFIKNKRDDYAFIY
jgi:membrane-associated phospholipid phosphatase